MIPSSVTMGFTTSLLSGPVERLKPATSCQDFLEVGDVVEVLPNPTTPITIGNFTYHPQTIALLPWFEFEQNSSAIDDAYSYPDETVLASLSPNLVDVPTLNALGCF